MQSGSCPYDFQFSGLYFFGSGQAFARVLWLRPAATSRSCCGRTARSSTASRRAACRTTPGTYGYLIHRVDIRLLHRFRLARRSNADSSAEVFNLFNHANYGSYVTAEVSPLVRPAATEFQRRVPAAHAAAWVPPSRSDRQRVSRTRRTEDTKGAREPEAEIRPLCPLLSSVTLRVRRRRRAAGCPRRAGWRGTR